MNSFIKLFLLVILMIIYSNHINANRDFINGTNYKCNDNGIVIELPNHLRKPCMLCTCNKGLVTCEKIKPCANNYKPDRRRRSIRCIEEECCNLVDDIFLNNNSEDGGSHKFSYRTLENNHNEINNQIKTSTIRYIHCPSELLRNNQLNELSNNSNSDFINRLTKTSINPINSRSTINTRSVTTNPNRQRDGLCTLSHSINSDTNKHRQYITTFDGMKMRLKTNNNCHFVFARDCEQERFTMHLQYSNHHLNNNSINKLNPIHISNELDSINLTTAHKLLDGETTSNYTLRYLTSLKQNKILSKENLSLFIRIDRHKIKLDNNLNVKIDNRQILLPYVYRGIKIINYESYVIIKSDIGLRIIWSGQEIVASLPRNFQQRTCGLCANFNDDLTDDLKNRKGQLLQSQFRFFQSWTTGKNRQCMLNRHHKPTNKTEEILKETNLNNNSNETCQWTFRKKMKATKFCNSLKTNIPIDCFKNLGIDNYYEDCLEKMCPCNNRMCNCDILSSFVDKCSKFTNLNNINMTIFQNECPNFNKFDSIYTDNQSRTARTLETPKTDADELSKKKCPEGSVYSMCAPVDRFKVTCSDLSPKSEFTNNRLPDQIDMCLPGCKCEANKVWSNNFSKCISIDLCPSLSQNLRKRTASFNKLINRPKLNFS